MTYTVKCNWGYKIYDGEHATIESARASVMEQARLLADSGPNGSGYMASQLPRINRELESMDVDKTGSGTVWSLPGKGGTSWTIKKKSSWR